jgi:hypothetical protein
VGRYQISANGGATFPLLTGNNLVSGVVDDQIFYLSTTSSGRFRLPFTIRAWNRGFQKIGISSNGNVQLGVNPVSPQGTTAFTNDCLPSATFAKAAILPFWDDLFFDSNDTSHFFTEGIFTKTTGAAPHRRFAVNWQGHRFSDAGAIVLARVPRLVYGTIDPKAGAAGSVLNVLAEPKLNHRPQVDGGLLALECAALLTDFFASRR